LSPCRGANAARGALTPRKSGGDESARPQGPALQNGGAATRDGLPKSQRFTFGQRLDGAALDALLLSVRARYATVERKRGQLEALNLKLEELRVLWRLVHAREWISRQQLFFVQEKIDEAGRMAGGWLKQTTSRAGCVQT
jgi:hypothetical protein